MQILIDEIKKLNRPVLYETGGNTEFISKNIFDLTGYYAEEIIINRDLFPGLINPEDYIETNFKVKNWHKQGEEGILVMTFRLRMSNGETIWIEDYLSGRTVENLKYMQGIMIDITNVKKEATLILQKKHQHLSESEKNKKIIEELDIELESFEERQKQRNKLVENILSLMKEKQVNFQDLNLDFLSAK